MAVVVVGFLLASGCGAATDAAADDAQPSVVTVEAAERAVGDGVTLTVVDDLDIEDVVAAALLIASGGDLEAAISAGLVGEAEAEAALDALERGSLDQILGS